MDYTFPERLQLSEECKDLVSRLLVADPARRITLPDILRHPWYLRDLPAGVGEMNDDLLATPEDFDDPSSQV